MASEGGESNEIIKKCIPANLTMKLYSLNENLAILCGIGLTAGLWFGPNEALEENVNKPKAIRWRV